MSAVAALLEKTPAARLREESRPTPISPTGYAGTEKTFVEEIRLPPRLTLGLNAIWYNAKSGPFCQIELLVELNSRLRPTLVAMLVVVNQREVKFVMNALAGERMAR